MSQCFRWILIGAGTLLLMAAVLPFVLLLRIPEPYATEFMAAKLVMLPLGAVCVICASLLPKRLRR